MHNQALKLMRVAIKTATILVMYSFKMMNFRHCPTLLTQIDRLNASILLLLLFFFASFLSSWFYFAFWCMVRGRYCRPRLLLGGQVWRNLQRLASPKWIMWMTTLSSLCLSDQKAHTRQFTVNTTQLIHFSEPYPCNSGNLSASE